MSGGETEGGGRNSTREWFAVAAVLLLLSSRLCGQGDTMPARRAVVPPAIDGDLSDAAWRLAATATDFVTSDGKPASAVTTAFLVYDDEHLYVAFKCDEPLVSEIKGTATTEKDFFPTGDDIVTLFVKPGLSQSIYYQFGVNAKGNKLDQEKGGGGTKGYNPEWRAATRIGEHGWTAEASIPFEAMNVKSQMGQPWRLNFCRRRSVDDEPSSWQHVFGSWHNVPKFGTLAGVILGGKTSGDCPFALRDVSLGDAAIGNNVLSARVQNRGKTAAGLRVQLTLRSPVGAVSESSVAAELGPRETKDIPLRYRVSAQQGTHTLTLALLAPDSGATVYESPASPIVVPSFLDTFLDRSYYTSEEEARVNVWLTLDAGAMEGLRVSSTLVQNGKELATERLSSLSTRNRLSFPISGLKNGEYTVVTRLADSAGHGLAESSNALAKYPPAADEVKVDKERRVVLVNGKPLFVLGAWNPPVEAYEELAEAGFNTVYYALPYSRHARRMTRETARRSTDLEGMMTVLKRAAETGLRASLRVLYFGWSSDLQRYRDMVPEIRETLRTVGEFSQKNPSLFGYRIMDEPYARGDDPEICRHFYKLAREVNPYNLPIIGFSRAVHFDLDGASDTVGVSAYDNLVPGRDISARLVRIEPAGKVATKLHRPFRFTPQVDSYAQSQRNITPKEQRCITYLALAYGANGIAWFAYNPAHNHPEAWDEVKRLIKEIKQLSPVLLAETPEWRLAAQAADSSVHVLPKAYGGDLYLVTVNGSRNGADATFMLSSMVPSSDVEVLLEDRTVKAEGGGFTDRFSGFGTHVYRVKKREAVEAPCEIAVLTEATGETYSPEDYYARKTLARYNGHAIFVQGTNNTLASMARDINNPEVCSYDPATRTAVVTPPILICYGSRLIVGDQDDPDKGETLKAAAGFDWIFGRLEVYHSRLEDCRYIKTRYHHPKVIIRDSEVIGCKFSLGIFLRSDGGDYDIRGADIHHGGAVIGHSTYHGPFVNCTIHDNSRLGRFSIGRRNARKAERKGSTGAFAFPFVFVDSRLWNNGEVPEGHEACNFVYVNTTDDNLPKYSFTTGSLTYKWHVGVKAVDKAGRPMQGLNVWFDTDGDVHDTNGTTDAEGLCLLDAAEFVQDSDGRRPFSYSVRVGGETGEGTVVKEAWTPTTNTWFTYSEGKGLSVTP